MSGRIPTRVACAALAVLVALPTVGPTVLIGAAPTPPDVGGGIGNGTIGNGTGGNIGNGTGGNLGNGSIGPGPIGNGTIGNGSLANGSLPGRDAPHFTDATATSGFNNQGYTRVAWGDYDNDGFDDIMFNGGALYRNNGDATFSDVSGTAGTRGGFSGGVWGDYNNDGYLDFYATAWAPTWDTLFRNNGDGTFTNVTALAGFPKDDLPSEAAAWADYDIDGCLDLYVANYEWPPLDGDTGTSYGTPNILWHNDCDGTFSNATIAAGVYEDYRSRGVVWGDYNNDGLPDLYVANYRLDPNELWQNRGNGSFVNVAMSAGVDCDNVSVIPNPTGACGHSIGADFADFNNDGDLDLYVANLAHPQFLALGHDTSQLYRNRGNPTYTFVDERESSGIRYCETASDPTFADFNSDGLMDLFVSSVYENRTNNLYIADRPGHYNEVTSQAGIDTDNGWGAGVSDFDRDGDLDLLVGSSTGVRLWRNDGNTAAYVELELVGRNTNKAAIGTVVRTALPGTFQALRADVQGGDGTGSQSSLRVFLGLGDAAGPDIGVIIQWPSGLNQNVRVPLNAITRVEEPEGIIDMAVTDLEAVPANPIASTSVQLTATVENVGTANAHNGSVEFYRDSVAPSNLVATRAFGNLSAPTNITVSTLAPASGTLTVIARLSGVEPQDQATGNDQQSLTVVVRPANMPPTANLTATPTALEANNPVHFDGSRSIDDSAIAQYIFDFGDGSSSLQNDSGADHVYLSPGSFIARLTVVDDNNAPSTNDASVVITVRPEGALPPSAFIDEITPASPEMRGSVVTFDGHGTATGGATIVAFEWSSSLDGVLSTMGTFQTDDLSLGQHVISLKVQDSNGLWSDPPAQATFRVVASGGVQITFLNLVEGIKVTAVITVNGSTSPPAGITVQRVQYRIDNSNYQVAQGQGTFSFTMDPQSYGLGPHNITVQVLDSDGLLSTRTVQVIFAEPTVAIPQINPLYLAGGAGGLILLAALGIGLRGRSKRKKAAAKTAAELRKLPVVAPPPPIRPIPVGPRGGAPRVPGEAPAKAPPKVRVKARPAAPPTRPPANP